MQRFFGTYKDNKLIISDEDIHRLLHVMRVQLYEKFEVVVDGKISICEVKSFNPFSYEIVETKEDNSELDVRLTLFMCLAKGDKLDLIIQKATEIGVHKIVLLSSKRCVAKYEDKDIDKKIARFNKIAIEACEQSHRSNIPEIVGVFNIKNIPQNLICDTNYLAYENLCQIEQPTLKIGDSKSISILIGPEGGISEDEADSLIKQGFKTVSLGNRILRCETAAIYSLSVLAYLIENKGK